MDPSKEGLHNHSSSYNSELAATAAGGGHPHPSGSPTYSGSSASSPNAPSSRLNHNSNNQYDGTHSIMQKVEGDNEKSEGVAIEQMENVDQPEGLNRGLKLRHMVMIAISGTIGTGLFLTSGKTIATAGPLGARKSPLPLRPLSILALFCVGVLIHQSLTSLLLILVIDSISYTYVRRLL